MHPLRTCIAGDIICEFLPPRRGNNTRAIVLCDGMPSVPSKRGVLEYWAKRGWWVFHPRYRGTWESGGKFLDHDPTEDIRDVVRAIRTDTLVNAYDGSAITPQSTHVSVIGSSFGGTVALLSSLCPEVDRVVAFSPVIDWAREYENPVEPLSWMKSFLAQGFGEAYRFHESDFDRLGRDRNFCNPISVCDRVDPKKLCIIYAKDDMIVSVPAIESFVTQIGCRSMVRSRGGHFSVSRSTTFFFGRAIRQFLR